MRKWTIKIHLITQLPLKQNPASEAAHQNTPSISCRSNPFQNPKLFVFGETSVLHCSAGRLHPSCAQTDGGATVDRLCQVIGFGARGAGGGWDWPGTGRGGDSGCGVVQCGVASSRCRQRTLESSRHTQQSDSHAGKARAEPRELLFARLFFSTVERVLALLVFHSARGLQVFFSFVTKKNTL